MWSSRDLEHWLFCQQDKSCNTESQRWKLVTKTGSALPLQPSLLPVLNSSPNNTLFWWGNTAETIREDTPHYFSKDPKVKRNFSLQMFPSHQAGKHLTEMVGKICWIHMSADLKENNVMAKSYMVHWNSCRKKLILEREYSSVMTYSNSYTRGGMTRKFNHLP